MTDPTMADHVYLLPLTTKSIIQILKEHPQIDAVFLQWVDKQH
jgi:carbamoyl-phosphate synthase large subunit